jgi:hypothetical protein
MTADQIRAILARAEKATNGPWCVDWTTLRLDAESDVYLQRDATSDDGIFINHARTDIPALCRDLLAAREALRESEPIICRHVCGDPSHSPLCEKIVAALGEEKA